MCLLPGGFYCIIINAIQIIIYSNLRSSSEKANHGERHTHTKKTVSYLSTAQTKGQFLNLDYRRGILLPIPIAIMH